jgi:recombination protein RecA
MAAPDVKDTKLDGERRKALNLAISQIEKQLGKGSIMRMGSESPRERVQAISTGAINLDAAIGIGGVPRGRITEIYGPESSGKTTLTLHLAANVQRAGGVAAYVDAEHALDVEYARKLGVDVDNLLVSQPDTGEQALEIVEILVRSGAVDIVVIDSVAALVPKAEIEGEMGDSHMGLQARLMSQALRKLAGAINRSNCAVVFINQLREKIGVMFGNPETTTGGKALKFYASVRLDIRRLGPVKEREAIIGNHVRVKVVKNKVAPPFKQAEFDVMFDEGISHCGLVVDIAAEANIIQKSGAWYSYGEQRIGQGRENAKLFLKDNPTLMTEVEGRVKEFLGMKPGAVATADGDDGDAD